MLVLDRNKIQYLSPNTAAPFGMLRAYKNAQAGMDGYGLGCGSGCAPQLGGLGLDLSSMLNTAAQFDPEPISATAMQIVGQFEQFFRIGAGRREADAIVPFQNRIHYEVLAPIAEVVNASYAQGLSGSQLSKLLDALLVTEDNWLNFLHNTEWADGRAATQAENTLQFLFDDQERKLRELLVDAPYFSNVDIPDVVSIAPGGGIVRTTRGGITPLGGSSLMRDASNYLPYILGGIAIFMLPKIGKW